MAVTPAVSAEATGTACSLRDPRRRATTGSCLAAFCRVSQQGQDGQPRALVKLPSTEPGRARGQHSRLGKCAGRPVPATPPSPRPPLPGEGSAHTAAIADLRLRLCRGLCARPCTWRGEYLGTL